MAVVAVAGDCATTTAVALAAAWPRAADVLVVEADPAGGDLAAWLDMPVDPSLSTAVTRATDGTWAEIDRHARLSDTGIRLLPAPARAAEAARAVGEAARTVVPTLAALHSPVTIADAGGLPAVPAGQPLTNPFVASAAVVVVVHRQAPQSARAAAVRLRRLADQLDSLSAGPAALVVAVVGAAPFDLAEIDDFLTDAVGRNPLVGLPHDELAASVLAGRSGVSERRLARLPLMRAARTLAATTDRALAAIGAPARGVAR